MDEIVISDKFKHHGNCSKYLIGYADHNIIRSLCIALTCISGYIKYFDDGRKNIPFEIESVLLKYNETSNKIKKTLNIKFYNQPIYDEKYIKTKVKTFNDVINTAFSDNEFPKQNTHDIYIAAINSDSIIKIDKKLSSSLSGIM